MKTPHILPRDATTKNRLDSRIPITKELERELLKHRPECHGLNHPVFAKGVPRARNLRLDLEKATQTALNATPKQEFSQSDDFETLVEVTRIEPEIPCSETPVNIKGSDFSPEAWTEVSGTDRQMLSRIIQRGGSLHNSLLDFLSIMSKMGL